MKRGDASTTSKQFSGHRGRHVQSQGVQGRVYVITDATTIPSQTEPSVVRGILLLFSSWARVLIDSGASHSFLSSSFASALELKVDVLRPSLFLESPVGGRVSLDRICRKCELVISDRLFVFDFVLLDMSSFDVILGMDWLSNFYATIDCYRRRVRVCTSEGEWFSFVREKSDPLEPSLSDPRSHESISCILASLISDEGMITRGELPLIVSEFPNVFPKDLYGLPPKREVEFSIVMLPKKDLVVC
ncbi:uncharacterized protein LOC130788169 [Actinidia eriantha]|uniref:uncharacterized protein LOC130788169 n=1 Tax=Actinidia eriantha TaxID=165200 RepID=UPI002588B7BE|nr:uncharacterized protein LOC130788169 [Actinidia eriantha]